MYTRGLTNLDNNGLNHVESAVLAVSCGHARKNSHNVVVSRLGFLRAVEYLVTNIRGECFQGV